MDHPRANPDELLRAVQRRETARGKLKIFLGASAGVGKTYAMLSEAQEQKRRGIDIVCGYVETHQRAETRALLAGLEVISLRTQNYRGSELKELDVPAILKRAPAVVLVDELAHSNVPGSTHAKRWQDINDILDAGISVFTAVNIQHLESLNDVVAKVSGVKVQETVPDAFFDQADEIELIDLSPAELQKRLQEGKVYVADRVPHALEGFFKTSNLTALRELALRRTADSVDAEMQRLRTEEGNQETWATKQRMLVCVAPNQLGPRVVRAAARLAAASHAEVIAVTVESDRQAGRPAAAHESAREAIDLARDFGFEVVSLHGHDIVQEILSLASRRNATLIVVGKPVTPRWRELLMGSVVDEIVRKSGAVDVHVITPDVESAPSPTLPARTPFVITPTAVAVMAALVPAITAVGFGVYYHVGYANIAMLYVLGSALAATRLNRWESTLLSFVSVLTFNYCFVEPRYTFAVSDSKNLVLFGGMVIVGILINNLTQQLRSELKNSSERERRTASLYALSRLLVQGRSQAELARAAAQEINRVFDGEAAVFLSDSGGLVPLATSESQFELGANEQAVAKWVADHGQPAGLGTDTLPGSSAHAVPLRGGEKVLGVLAFKPRVRQDDVSQSPLLETFANALGLALERTILARQSTEAKLSAESEKLRSTLLSSISHDLRTPLTSITGAASSLVHGHGDAKQLSETIYAESIRLNHQIQNLLDMTRLQSGHVELKKAWQSPAELVSSALEKSRSALGDRQVTVDISPQLDLFEADGLLVEKALINLFENAGRFTAPTDRISVRAFSEVGRLVFLITDTGPGIPVDAVGKILSPGFRAGGGGFGLGLAIVEGVVKLHGGRITASNLVPHGAAFRLEFPLPMHQPEVPVG